MAPPASATSRHTPTPLPETKARLLPRQRRRRPPCGHAPTKGVSFGHMSEVDGQPSHGTPSMDNPIHLSDSQLEQLLRAAAPLAPKDRSPSLADVAEALRGQALGDSAVFRIIRIRDAIFIRQNSPPRREIRALNGVLAACRLEPNRTTLALRFLDLQGLPATHCLETRLLSPSARLCKPTME